MKLKLVEYDYTHNKYITYAENTNQTVEGSLAIYPDTMIKSSDNVIGDLSNVAVQRGITTALADDDYIQIPQNEWAEFSFKNADNLIGQIGEFSDSSPATTANLGISHAGESASSKYQIYFRHPVGLQYYVSPNDNTPGTTPTFLSEDVAIGSGFNIKLYCESKIRITNNSAASEWIRIYDIYFAINSTVKSGVQTTAIYASYGNRLQYNPVTRNAYAVEARVLLAPISRKDVTWDGDNIFGAGSGRPFGRWIDNVRGGARSNGYNEDTSVIHNPIYIVESLYRDEIFVERDLQITSSASTTTFTCRNAISKSDDYYNNAEFYNVTTNVKRYITDYVGSTNTFTISSLDASMAAGNNIYLTNIWGDYKIDETTFDAIGNTTNGLRDGWEFARSIITKQPVQTLINEILYESHCILFEAADEDNGYAKIKVKALDSGSGDTWSKPAYKDGLPLINLSLTDLGQVFTSFKLFYHYDLGEGDYLKSILVDKNGYSNPSGGSTLTDAHKNLCAYAEKTYQVNNPFTYSSNWIYDDATAEYFLDKKINWFTKQRLKVNWTTPFCDNLNDIDYIKYELGDQVKLNYDKMIPSGLNNSVYFMITGKTIETNPQGSPNILWELIEI